MAKNGNKLGALALLRVVVGIVALYHGYYKLLVPGGFPATTTFFAGVGIPAAGYAALFSGLVELFGGIFLILGIFTRWSSLLLMFNFAVAFSYVHVKNGFNIGAKGQGYEYVMVLVAVLIVILLNGPGKYALGKMFKNRNLQ